MPPKSLFSFSSLHLGLALILFIGTGFYGVQQYTTMRGQLSAIENNSQGISKLTDQYNQEEMAYKKSADAHSKRQAEFGKKIASILPPDESYPALTRDLDKYFLEHDTPGNKIFQSSLRYGKSAPVEGAAGISALPFSMNIEATRDNFFKFLKFVESSGGLDNGLRLMDIKSIQLNFSEGGEVTSDPRQEINFTIYMNAYHQTPKVRRGV